MGWSLGTNDAANAFGTAVATRVVKYRTSIIIIASMVLLGSIIQGADDIDKLSSISTNNEVSADVQDMENVGVEFEKDENGNYVLNEDGSYKILSQDNVDKAALKTLRIKSAVKAAIIFACSALTVFVMSYLKFPVSANQAVTGAVIGWGLFHADYANPEVLSTNLAEIGKFASTWLLNPLGAAIISFVIVFFFKKFFEAKVESLKGYDKVIKVGYIVAGAYSAYTIGINSSASVTAFYYDSFGVGANILTNARLTAILGGLASAVGVLTYSKKVMKKLKGSAFILASMFAAQSSALDMFMYYDLRPSDFCGPFETGTYRILKPYYSFITFRNLRRLGTEIPFETGDNVYGCAATDGKKYAVALTHYNDKTDDDVKEIKLSLTGLHGKKEATVYVLDETRDLEPTRAEVFTADEFSIYLKVPNFTTVYIEIE